MGESVGVMPWIVGERGLETGLVKHTRKIVPPWFNCRFKEE